MKKKLDDKRVKLLVSVTSKDNQEKLTETVNRYGTVFHFSGIGHGTARSHHRSYFGIDDVEKRVTLSLIPSNLERKILDGISRELKLFLFGKGIAFTTSLSAISNLVEEPIISSSDKDSLKPARNQTQKKEKDIMHELVIAVVNEKYTDEAVDAARAAGATGATVLHTRSTNNAKIEQAIGTSLPSDTDSIFLLTTTAYKAKIMEALRDSVGLKTEGSAIIFSVPVDDLVGIGRFDSEPTEE